MSYEMIVWKRTEQVDKGNYRQQNYCRNEGSEDFETKNKGPVGKFRGHKYGQMVVGFP